MPDWSYQTLFRPVLFQLPSKPARDFTLNAMGFLSRLPGGSLVIRTLGHMETAPVLQTELEGVPLKYPVGLSGGLDTRGTAHRAMAQFGFGFIEIGPVTVRETASELPIRRNVLEEAILYPDDGVNEGLDKTVRCLQKPQGHSLPLMLRLRSAPGLPPGEALEEQRQLMERLLPHASAFYIELHGSTGGSIEQTALYLEGVQQLGRSLPVALPMLLYIPLDYPNDKLQQLLTVLSMDGWSGIVIGDMRRSEEGYVTGKDGKPLCLEKVALVRRLCGQAIPVIATAGVHEPQDALDLMHAGASYIQLHSGLVYAGPGLPKRINEAVIYERIRCSRPPADPSFWYNWGWMCLLGIGMMIGGLLAWIIAATSVVLPYDVSFLGMGAPELHEANPFVLQFMSHDRVTLAGTMISIGIMYFQLARYGQRKGLHWANTALITSCLVGFSSFFLYLGYGYFDPLHALAAALLLPMFILSLRKSAELPSYDPPNVLNDRLWRQAQWGQLMFVILGVSLAVGGAVIAVVGITQVFVPQDLEYLCATPAMLQAINDRLLPLIAHDRAGFGGALFSNALAILTTALWGVNQGQRWLWWTFLIGGMPGFAAGFTVHWHIGYTDFLHLLPAYFAFAVYAAGLILLYPYLCAKRK
jgi:dihydroorotate dehydrogenase